MDPNGEAAISRLNIVERSLHKIIGFWLVLTPSKILEVHCTKQAKIKQQNLFHTRNARVTLDRLRGFIYVF